MRALLCCCLFGLFSGSLAAYDDPHCVKNTLTIVNLFEWKWTDIEKECSFLAKAGYCAVQTSVPTEHVVTTAWVWWDRYKPVSYKLETRSGNETQLASMVETCNKLGVRIYVDIQLNHMSNGAGVGTSGSAFDSSTYDFPGVPYKKEHFHSSSDCQSPRLTVDSTSDDLRKCEVINLPDIDQSNSEVQAIMVTFLNKLVDMGVAGFRLDVAQHMYPKDLKDIFDQVHDVTWGGRPFLINEVVNSLPHSIWADEYFDLGYVTECIYAEKIGEALKKQATMTSMCNIFKDSIPSKHALVFVDNVNFQRSRNRRFTTIITYKDQDIYTQAQAYTLASGYGIPRILSSYEFSDSEQGPPHDGKGNVLDVVINADGTCANGWVCEHRWPIITEMVEFANRMRANPLKNCEDSGKFVSFTREDQGFFRMAQQVQDGFDKATGLQEGSYCDQIDECNSATYTVNADGRLITKGQVETTVALRKVEDSVKETPTAAHTVKPIPAATTTEPTTSTSSPAQWKRTVILLEKGTHGGDDVFFRGAPYGCFDREKCSVPIQHRDLELADQKQLEKRNKWAESDTKLDWKDFESKQGVWNGKTAGGSPGQWTTNDKANGLYHHLNNLGRDYWILDVNMDCSKTPNDLFIFKGYITYKNGGGDWESNIPHSSDLCSVDPDGESTINHVAHCGKINIFRWNLEPCTVKDFPAQSSQKTK